VWFRYSAIRWPACGCVAFWRGLQKDERGKNRIAVNLRLLEPAAVAHIPIDHFDGLETMMISYVNVFG
jgi:hypothetical protein